MLLQLQNKEELPWKKFLKDNKEVMTKLKITQVKSSIGSDKRQKETLKALGLRKLNQTVEHNANPQIQGMVNKLKHLLNVEELS